ncbi:hypothetical protein RclHR1_02540028 [Rhizophagus clarus]|uniref:Uncharacterized protein n=1 Tax=Rhizophagus clarus TaxID=94130 RepID=A0A2Z6RC10_9GLOM|nr:hypothetical protein RclHR1_02540028 [Rhizophagus clarus]GES82040.1 hypothetical protein GLOIN_2v1762755 [Rhizophagus clarus]
MKKLLILIFITLIILLQFINEANSIQVPKDISLAPPPAGGASLVEGTAPSPAPAIPPSTKVNTFFAPIPAFTTFTTGKLSPTEPSLLPAVNFFPSNNVKSTSDIVASIVGGVISNLILNFIICLCYFLMRIYKNKKVTSEATIATPETNNNENGNNISNPGVTKDELYNGPTSNHGQEFIPNSLNHNNQQGTTRELGNNFVDNEIIQNIRQTMTQNISFNIDENIIDRMKQDILQDIKQELKQNIRTKVMTSFVRDDIVKESSSSSSKNYI